MRRHALNQLSAETLSLTPRPRPNRRRGQEEIAEARRKRNLNVLFLGMTRVAEYDVKGGLAKGMERFEFVERMLREDMNEANMNPLRCVCCVCAREPKFASICRAAQLT